MLKKPTERFVKSTKMLFWQKISLGTAPNFWECFWNRYRANVNYTVEVENFKSAIAHGDKMIPIFDCKIHDCIDIVREAQKGRMSNSNHDFAELARTVLERIKEMDGTEC